MTKTVLLRSRVRGNPQARFWRAVGVVTPSLTLIRWMGLEIPYISSKSGHIRYSIRKPNRIVTPVNHYWIRHSQRFLTPKTDISMSKEINLHTTAIFPIGASVKASSTTDIPLKPLDGNAIHVHPAD